MATWLFVHQLVQGNIKEYTKALYIEETINDCWILPTKGQ